MRNDFMERINARDNENNNKTKYDVASYPFGAEEMLLNQELEQLEEKKKEVLEK